MAVATLKTETVSIAAENESRTRYELALVCRISDFMGLSDCCAGFTSARVPDSEILLLRGNSQHPRVVTASSLFRATMDEVPIKRKNYPINAGALMMSQAIYKARPDVGAIFHGHTPASMVFSTLDVEVLPISQFGTMFHGLIRKVEFGEVDNKDWCDALVSGLGGNPGLVFGNHGMLVVGRDCKQAMHNFYALDQAMQIQIAAMQTGAKINVLDQALASKIRDVYWGGDETTDYNGTREWESWVQIATSLDPGFAN